MSEPNIFPTACDGQTRTSTFCHPTKLDIKAHQTPNTQNVAILSYNYKPTMYLFNLKPLFFISLCSVAKPYAFTTRKKSYSIENKTQKQNEKGSLTTYPSSLSIRNDFTLKSSIDSNDISEDYLITDSKFIESRPSFFSSVQNPRDFLALLVVFNGILISYYNVLGDYNTTYMQFEQCAIILGILSSISYIIQIFNGYTISTNMRRGLVDEAVINLYCAFYTFAVSWLAYRTSDFCPDWLWSLDGVLPWLCSGIFLFSFIAPVVTLLPPNVVGDRLCKQMVNISRAFQNNSNMVINEQPELSETELLRARGLLFIGILGSIFLPDAISFGIGQQEWWERVYSMHHSQRILESSTSLFALFATEASMISHRMAKKGVATFKTIVPTFAFVCFVLAVVPCISSLYWLGDDISFFSFYRE